MPTINAQSKEMQNGDVVLSYTNTVGPQSETFTFETPQETVILFNKGSKGITYSIGAQSGTLYPSQNVKVTGSITSVSLNSEGETQHFEIWAEEEGTKGALNAAVQTLDSKVTELTSSLAQNMKFSAPSNTIVLLGDSITAQNSTYQENTNTNDYGYFDWANAFLSQRFKVLKNAGIGGNRTDQMLARIDADVLAYKPAWCMLYGGINDIGQGRLAEDAFGYLKNMYEKLLDGGIRVIGATITPGTNIDTAEKKIQYFKLNSLIRQYALENPNLILVDFASAYIDPNNVNPVPIANATLDGVHPVGHGAVKMGKILADAVLPYTPSVPVFTNSNYDPNVLNPNSMMIGTTGALGNGSVTGVIATNWTALVGIGSLVGSKVPRTDGMPGEWQQLKMSGGDTTSNPQLYYVATSGFAVGEKYVGISEVELDSDCANIKYINISVEARNGSTGIGSVGSLTHPGSDPNLNYNPKKITLKTNPIVVPTNTTTLRIFVFVRLTDGTFRIGRTEMRKIS